MIYADGAIKMVQMFCQRGGDDMLINVEKPILKLIETLMKVLSKVSNDFNRLRNS